MYEKQKTISTPISNNRFDYDKRIHHEIVVPSLIEGTLDDITIGDTIAIECAVGGTIQPTCGLRHFVFLKNARVPTWIMDNHNHAFAFWHEAYWKGYIQPGNLLVHIDQHTDLATPTNFPAWNHPEQTTELLVEEYTNTDLTIADFIVPAMATGLISEAVMVTGEKRNGTGLYTIDQIEKNLIPNSPSVRPKRTEGARGCSYDFEENQQSTINDKLLTENSIIVDLDLDYFSQGFNEEICLKNVQYWLQKADIVTIATSPLFIEQEKALSMLRKII